jgi:hypothetical protein
MIRALLVTTALVLAGAASAAGSSGRLSGTTLISFGCPGPIREGEPGCNPWRPFAGARLSVAGRTIVSDAKGRFGLSLRPGTYVLTALPQARTRGEIRLVVRLRAGRATSVLVRFDGYPKMV